MLEAREGKDMRDMGREGGGGGGGESCLPITIKELYMLQSNGRDATLI